MDDQTDFRGNNPDLFEKLSAEFKVRPLVFEMDCYRVGSSCFCTNRLSALVGFILTGKYTRRNFDIIRYIWNNPCTDGYIMMDSKESLLKCYDLVFAHEFLHSFQKVSGTITRDIHDIRELEADMLSAVFLIKNNIDVAGQVQSLRTNYGDDSVFTFLKEMIPFFRVIAFILVSLELIKLII